MPEPRSGTEQNWAAHLEREESRYRDGESRLPGVEDADARQRQLTRLGNAAGGAGLALLMQGRPDEAADWFQRAAARYRESFADAPPGSWGRPIGAIKSLVLAGDWPGAEEAARWALDAGAAAKRRLRSAATRQHSRSRPRRRRAGAGARRRDPHARRLSPATSATRSPTSPRRTSSGTSEAIEAVLESFEAREEYLEDMPVADTVLVLQALARRRGIEAELSSPLLP